MKIKHEPLFNTDAIIEHYEKKDGVDIKYVCTTDLSVSDVPVDVFYRETPHPEFGNRYLGLYIDPRTGRMMITNADSVEKYGFAMISGDNDDWYYSPSHHTPISVGSKMVDGGREYARGIGFEMFKIKDGEFVKVDYEETE